MAIKKFRVHYSTSDLNLSKRSRTCWYKSFSSFENVDHGQKERKKKMVKREEMKKGTHSFVRVPERPVVNFLKIRRFDRVRWNLRQWNVLHRAETAEWGKQEARWKGDASFHYVSNWNSDLEREKRSLWISRLEEEIVESKGRTNQRKWGECKYICTYLYVYCWSGYHF